MSHGPKDIPQTLHKLFVETQHFRFFFSLLLLEHRIRKIQDIWINITRIPLLSRCVFSYFIHTRPLHYRDTPWLGSWCAWTGLGSGCGSREYCTTTAEAVTEVRSASIELQNNLINIRRKSY